MEDAVILANCLYDIGATSPEDIGAALTSFMDQRLPHVMEQYHASQVRSQRIGKKRKRYDGHEKQRVDIMRLLVLSYHKNKQ